MFVQKRFLALFSVAVGFFGVASAQDLPKSEVSAQYFGSFSSVTWDHGVQHSATDSGGVLANYRYFFDNYNGVEVSYGFTRNTQKFAFNPYQLIGVPTNNHETTAAYVFRYPVRRIVPFGLAGIGSLVFDPRTDLINPPFQMNPVSIGVQARVAFVYGGGVDINMSDHWFLRGQYRGYVYSTPDFNTYNLGPSRVTHRSEPSFGIGFRF